MAEFFDMYCENRSIAKKLEEFSKLNQTYTRIGVDWLETWVNDQGKELTIECCFNVESSKKASNLVGALLLGLKTHKNFPKQVVISIDGDEGDDGMADGWSKLTKDFHHFSTKVKYLS